MSEPVAWINGQFVPISQATVHVFDTGLVHGDAVTEMLRTFGGEPFRLEQHLRRLRHSLEGVLLECPIPDSEWKRVVYELVARNRPQIPGSPDLGIILFVTGGPNTTYIGRVPHAGPTMCAHTFPLHFELWREGFTHGLSLRVAPQPAAAVVGPSPTSKVRSRIGWRLADRTVRRSDPHAVAILKDAEGSLTETSAANFFAVIDGEIRTPPADRVLPGVSRSAVIELSQRLGLTVRETSISPDEARKATEMWLTSTPSCMLPVARFEGEPVGAGVPGALFGRILAEWSRDVGLDLAAQFRG